MTKSLNLGLMPGKDFVELPTTSPYTQNLVLQNTTVPATPGAVVKTAWVPGGGGGGGTGLPTATAEGQVLMSGPAPFFGWLADDIDCGRY